jgi:uncharacterized protein (DUF2141 family)
MRKFAAALIAMPLVSATAPSASVEVDLSALRSTRGTIHACLTRIPQHFPNCEKDPQALKETVPATQHQLHFSDVPIGRYALSVFHDENSNRKLDTIVGIPKEGFGFSRNPVIRFGPPRFDKVSIELSPGFTRTSVRMQYLL